MRIRRIVSSKGILIKDRMRFLACPKLGYIDQWRDRFNHGRYMF